MTPVTIPPIRSRVLNGMPRFRSLELFHRFKTLVEEFSTLPRHSKQSAGVTLDNAEKLAASGSDIFVMGTYIFEAEDVRAHTEHVKKQLVKYKQC